MADTTAIAILQAGCFCILAGEERLIAGFTNYGDNVSTGIGGVKHRA
jgi:hypothetical protein